MLLCVSTCSMACASIFTTAMSLISGHRATRLSFASMPTAVRRRAPIKSWSWDCANLTGSCVNWNVRSRKVRRQRCEGEPDSSDAAPPFCHFPPRPTAFNQEHRYDEQDCIYSKNPSRSNHARRNCASDAQAGPPLRSGIILSSNTVTPSRSTL